MLFLLFFLFFSSLQAAESERVLGVGAATIDLLVFVDDQFLQNYPSITKGGSTPSHSDTIDRILQESRCSPKIVPGGSAANTIRALAKLGEKCAFYTYVGRDIYGHHFSQNMEYLGIEQRFNTSHHSATSHVLCLVTPDSQRTFLAFDPQIRDHSPDVEDFKNLKWIHIEARQLKSGICVEKIMQFSKENGAGISLDLSSFEIVNEFKNDLLKLIPQYVDIVFCNESEIKALTGLSPEEGCLKLQELCPIAVVTKGPEGCLVGHQNHLLSIPTFPAIAIDSTGAGDLFAAGFLYGHLKGYPLATSGSIGNRLGSAIVEILGAELPEDRWASIATFLSQVHLQSACLRDQKPGN